MKKVAVVGIGTAPWQMRNSAQTFRAMAMEVVKGALGHSGLSKEDIDNVVYSVYCET